MDRNNSIEIHPTRIEVEGKHFDLDILMGGDMKILQPVLGLGGSLWNYSCPWPEI
jgi:hypothetical protein